MRAFLSSLPQLHSGEITDSERLAVTLAEIREYINRRGGNFDEVVAQSKLINPLAPDENGYGYPHDRSKPMEYLVGKVKYFNPAEGKCFGFMEDETFFHLDRGRVLGCNGGDAPANMGKETSRPLKGTSLVYMKAFLKKGPAAEWWAFEYTYQQALKDIEARPTYRFFRYQPDGGRKLWEGKNLDKLRLLYSLKWHQSDPRYDVSGYSFQKQLPDGSWVDCEDPR